MARPQRKLEVGAGFPVPRSAAAPSDESVRDYRSRPSESDIALFLDHVREKGEPESFLGICRTKPPRDSRPIFLRRFDIDRKKRRDGQMAPCPICSPNDPKFLHEGYLVWYPDEEVIRAIGPECGDTVFGGTAYAEAKETFDRAERERRAVGFLEKNLRKALAMVVALEAIRPAATEADRLYAELKRRAPNAQQVLRGIRAGGGVLKVSIVTERDETDENLIEGPRGFRRRDSAYDAHEEVIGNLPDTTILNANFTASKDWREIHDLLLTMPRFESEERAFLWICDQSEHLKQLEVAVAVLQQCSMRYVKLSDRLDRFLQFFSRSLFSQLDLWGRHSENSVYMEAGCENGEFSLRYGRRHADREEVHLRPDLPKLTARGNWPGLE
jgi:hypothetical protein